MRTLRTVLAAAGVTTSLGLILMAACNGPGPDDEPCTSAGGVCQNQDLECAESFPYPCASPVNVCCRGSAHPSPAPTPSSSSSPPPSADASAE